MSTPESVVPLSQRLADSLTEKFVQEKYFPSVVTAVPVDEAFDKLVVRSYAGTPSPESYSFGEKAYAFVERETGKLFPAASWRFPAETAQHDLTNEVEYSRIVEIADIDSDFLRVPNKSYKYESTPKYSS